MNILNIMLSRDLGGIQQAFLDYNFALKSQGAVVNNVTSIGSAINSILDPKPKTLLNLGNWDLLSLYLLNRYIKSLELDIIIAHGNRAVHFCNFIKMPRIPLVAVAHNYTIKYIKNADYIIAVTDHLRQYIIKTLNFPNNRIFVIPNMITINNIFSFNQYSIIPIIGVVSRLIKKKGLDLFLYALALLKKQGHRFKAVIGGDGDQKKNLIKLADNLGVKDEVKFVGWVYDKEKFFKNIDIFCLPSYHEPFGLVLLEAMQHSKPCVVTASEGPSEIIRHNVTGIITRMDYLDLAQGLLMVLYNQEYGKFLAKNAFDMIFSDYSTTYVSQELIYRIVNIVKNVSKKHFK